MSAFGNVSMQELLDAWESRLQALKMERDHIYTDEYKRLMRPWTTVISRIPGSKKLTWIPLPSSDGGRRAHCIIKNVILLEWHP